MKPQMTLIEFLGIPPRKYESDFPKPEITDSPTMYDDSIAPMVNPCSGLPTIDNRSLFDSEGNAFGTCDSSDTDLGLADDLSPIPDTYDALHSADDALETSDILSVVTDTFDDATTQAFLDDGYSDTITDNTFDSSWDEW